jgi:FtsP/CotA-like multicopper oxidase with cupredoxin domain
MHGHGFTSNGVQMDALGKFLLLSTEKERNALIILDINDGEMFTLYMTATTPGVWMMLCHIGDHISVGGMAAFYTVSDNKSPNPNLAVTFGLHL